MVFKNKMYDNRISKIICCQCVEHQWKLGNNIIENVSSMYILGVAFNNNLKNNTPVNECQVHCVMRWELRAKSDFIV